MSKSMSRNPAAIPDTLDDLINTRFTHKFIQIIPPWKNIMIVSCHHLECIEYIYRLSQ